VIATQRAERAAVDVFIRAACAEDQSYIASTLMHSIRTPRGLPMPKRDSNAVVDYLLDAKGVRLLVACNEDGKIVGWLCWSPLTATRLVHYVYVRKDWRQRGIAKALMSGAHLDDERSSLVYTLKGLSADWLLDLYPHAVYVPIQEAIS